MGYISSQKIPQNSRTCLRTCRRHHLESNVLLEMPHSGKSSPRKLSHVRPLPDEPRALCARSGELSENGIISVGTKTTIHRRGGGDRGLGWREREMRGEGTIVHPTIRPSIHEPHNNYLLARWSPASSLAKNIYRVRCTFFLERWYLQFQIGKKIFWFWTKKYC